MNASLDDRTAIVTGAGQGIGRSVAVAFAKAGARVAVVDIDANSAHRVVEEIEAHGGAAKAFECDVSVRANVDRTNHSISEALGTADILVNNAGISRPAMLWKMTDEQWDSVIGTNLSSSFYWIQAVVPAMREAQYGRIIMTTSAAGLVGSIGQINYSAAKAGMIGMTRSAAKELASAGILVNAVAPSAATPMTETIRTDERFRDKYLEDKLIKRWAEPEEIAQTYVFLASEASSYMTGQVLAVDGGRVMMR